jgi:hypothetical protein
MPFGKKEAYTKAVRKASLEKLACLIKVCGFLMQTRVYLFWKRLSQLANAKVHQKDVHA